MVPSVQLCFDSRQRVFALVSAMASMVETAVDQAIDALLRADRQLAETILKREPVINQLEMQIDEAVLAALANKTLPYDEVRFMSAVLRINKDMERIGDLAANIGRKILERAEPTEKSDSDELQPMAIAVSHICRKTLRAVLRQDLVLAESALGSEAAVQAYRNYVFRRMRERLGGRADKIQADLDLLLASRYLEQMADHAVNLAENLLFCLRKDAQKLLA
jgi:phosphate transport system protein